MLLQQTFFEFLSKHPLALCASLLLHAGIGFAFWFSVQGDDGPVSLNQLRQKTTKITSQDLLEKAKQNPKNIQAAVVDAVEVNKQIALLKKQHKEKKQLEKAKLQHLNQQQQALRKERKKFTETRKKEEQILAQLKKQKAELDAQRKILLAKTKEEEAKLLVQKQQSQSLQKNLQQIRQQEKQIAERLENLQKQSSDVKKANEEAIKSALKQQRTLEAKRLKEELKIAQAKQQQSQLERQQQQTTQELILSQQKKAQLEDANRKQLSLLKKQYIVAIRTAVKEKWRRPVDTQSNWSCEVAVRQSAQGMVENVNIKSCSSQVSQRFRQSVTKAVFRAEPLPKPPNIKVFDKDITFVFKP